MTKENINNPTRRSLIAAAAALPLLAGGAKAFAAGRPTSYAGVGKLAPKFHAPLHGGGNFSNRNFAGKVTILDFFGLWCPDCMADTPHVAEVVKLVRANRGLQFVGVHTRGRYGRWGNLNNYFKEKGFSYPVAVDDDSAVYKAFGLAWVPSYVIIDSKGVIRDYVTDLGAGGIGARALVARANKFKQHKSK